LQHDGRVRDLVMFNVAIDSKLRGCDLVRLRIGDVHFGDTIRLRTTIIQQKTGRPVPHRSGHAAVPVSTSGKAPEPGIKRPPATLPKRT
jgi:hypothetical protein